MATWDNYDLTRMEWKTYYMVINKHFPDRNNKSFKQYRNLYSNFLFIFLSFLLTDFMFWKKNREWKKGKRNKTKLKEYFLHLKDLYLSYLFFENSHVSIFFITDTNIFCTMDWQVHSITTNRCWTDKHVNYFCQMCNEWTKLWVTTEMASHFVAETAMIKIGWGENGIHYPPSIKLSGDTMELSKFLSFNAM
jgi:hypothetical protein